MPELPEVETIRKGIIPYCEGKVVRKLISRCNSLRWPIPENLSHLLSDQILNKITRRGKYLLLHFNHGTLLLHLGMSGYLRLLREDTPLLKHDHLDIIFNDDTCLRLNDSRRFGAALWTPDHERHPLLCDLGPEPLSSAFSAAYIEKRAKGRAVPVKTFIMNSRVVVGVGNIYANEALFKAGIHPLTPAGRLKASQWRELLANIKSVLNLAIASGGTTLRDFRDGHGKPGYFQQKLTVYGRAGEACRVCKTKLEEIRLGQRTTVFCPKCQKEG